MSPRPTTCPSSTHAAGGLGVVEELHRPAPLAVIVGVPPRLQYAGLAAGQDHQPAEVCVRRPAVLERDLVTAADEERHRPLLVTFESFAARNRRTGPVRDEHVKLGR